MRLRCLPEFGVAALILLCAPSPARAAESPPKAADRPPLPAGFAPNELGRPLPNPELPSSPPSGVVHTPTEYDQNSGLLIRWGDFDSVLDALTVAITTHDPSATVWVVVSGSAQQASAAAELTNHGANMAHVGFLTIPTDSVWIRDYGPRFILDDNSPAIVDATYNRPRPLDDALPGVVATDWSLPLFQLPLVLGGGNLHLFRDGEAFMTDLVLNENPGDTGTDIANLFAQYENLSVTIWPGFPTNYDETQHIDMWMLPVRDKVAIIGQYALGEGAPHTITENAAAELGGRGYTVYRTPGWCAGCPFGTHYTYTNAVVFNKLVLIPSYLGYATENAEALAVYQLAFPGKQIVQIDSSVLVQSAGVLHCIVMHVPDPHWIFSDDFASGDTAQWSVATP